MTNGEDLKTANSREFVRVIVKIPVHFRAVTREETETLEREFLSRPAGWGLNEEGALRDLAISPSGGSEGILARAILEITAQVGRLTGETEASDGPRQVGELVDLSGGGGLLQTETTLASGDFLDIRFTYEDKAPPLRALVEILLQRTTHSEGYAFRFHTIHRLDQERLIRHVYDIQRQAMETSDHLEDASS